jgi:hypothetical protein
VRSGVSSFNTFLQEYDSESEPDDGSGNESEYASGLDDGNSVPLQGRRGRSPLWKRSLRKLFSPFRVL